MRGCIQEEESPGNSRQESFIGIDWTADGTDFGEVKQSQGLAMGIVS